MENKDGDEDKLRNIKEVRYEELKLIRAKRKRLNDSVTGSQKDFDVDADKAAWDNKLLGLAFSGGGIRSATFNLGLLQALAKYKLLSRIDYISTVSGGGYIGAWLTALLQREQHRIASLFKKCSSDENNDHKVKTAVERVEDRLNPDYARNNQNTKLPEDPAISHLRKYSNYLTPRLGFFSGDTWSLINTYLRNVILNQIILVLAIASLLLVPRLVAEIFHEFSYSPEWIWAVPIVIGIGFYAFHLVSNLIKWKQDSDPNKPIKNIILPKTYFIMGIISPALAIIVLLYLLRVNEQNLVNNVLVSIAIFASITGWYLGRNITSVTDADPAKPNPHTAGQLLSRVVVPLVIISFLLTAIIPINKVFVSIPIASEPQMVASINMVLIVAAIYLIIWLTATVSAALAYLSGWLPLGNKKELIGWIVSWAKIILWGVISSSIVVSLSLYGLGILRIHLGSASHWVVLFIPPLILLSVTLTGVLHIGLASGSFKNQQREWLSRMGAWLMIVSLAWFAFAGITFASPIVWAALKELVSDDDLLQTIIASGWLSTVIAGVVAGKKEKEKGLITGLLATITPYIFIVGLIFFISNAVELAMETIQLILPYGEITTTLLFMLFLMAIGAIFSIKFDINEFSLHRMYENRLTRCFLGATTECRYQNPFTGFSLQDDIPLAISPQKPEKSTDDINYELGFSAKERKALGTEITPTFYPGPYPLVNTAINLVGGGRLAWQERKAASFLLSPLYCGFQLSEQKREDIRCAKPGCNVCFKQSCIDMYASGRKPCCSEDQGKGIEICLANAKKEAEKNNKKTDYLSLLRKGEDPNLLHCYQKTAEYAADGSYELTLGDAIATSGAAASPNMGYHSTPALAFLMTMFNLRLGRWIGNPIKSDWRRSGPRFSLWHLLKEVFGVTNDDAKYVYLSDGGHFENLAIYELVRRHCRYIIASDAGADPHYKFEDLANAIRKCRIDFGVEISIDVSELQNIDDKGNNAASCAVGKIYYPNGDVGTLLYIKASRLSGMPTDTRQYANKNKTFPHETTADQFFSESQFESYRRLGLHIGKHCFDTAVNVASKKSDNNKINIEIFFNALKQHWYKRRKSENEDHARYMQALESLFKQLSERDELSFLNKQFYPEWQVFPSDDIEVFNEADLSEGMFVIPKDAKIFRAGFYFCNSLIQLMENVYLGLDLENEYAHPDNAGWINLFKHWSWSGMFRVTWAVSAATYGRRFRSFCEYSLDLASLNKETISLQKFEGKEIYRLLYEPDSDNASSKEPAPETEKISPKLNALERWQLNQLIENHYTNKVVYQFNFSVIRPVVLSQTDGTDTDLFSFCFGYALIEDNKVIMLRVQDHLRNMGLGRESIRKLLAEDSRLIYADANYAVSKLKKIGLSKPEGRVRKFIKLYSSVKAE